MRSLPRHNVSQSTDLIAVIIYRVIQKEEPISKRNILLQKIIQNSHQNHKYFTHSQVLFPALQVFSVAITCSMDNV